MKFKMLRIAWSVGWGIVCVMLIGLWVRSDYWVDQVYVPVTQFTYVALGSMPSAISGRLTDKSPTGTWAMLNMPTVEWLAAVSESSDSWVGCRHFQNCRWRPHYAALVWRAIVGHTRDRPLDLALQPPYSANHHDTGCRCAGAGGLRGEQIIPNLIDSWIAAVATATTSCGS